MGNCLGTDVKSKYEVAGTANAGESQREAQIEAEEMIHGSLAYCTWIMLSLGARKLKEADLFSKSDAMGILYEKKDNAWVEVGRTEMVANSQDPNFVTRFKVLYNFEKIQSYKILMVDVDKGQDPKKVNPDSCDFLGQGEFNLSEVVTATGKKLGRTMVNKENRNTNSTMVLIAEEMSNAKEVYRIKMSASNVKNLEKFGNRSDPFLQISRMQDDGATWLPVFKTGVRRDNLNPVWDEIVVRATQLNNGDLVRPLKLQVFDHEGSGSHRLLGQVQLSTERMIELAAQHGAVVPLEPPPGKPPGDYGTLQVQSFNVQTRASFIDYLTGGTEIGFVVAVDFTASNGDPRTPGSKHYFTSGATQYEKAIMGIGQVLENYDHDKMFPMFGFGGQYQKSPTSHCFAMGPPPESACHGVNGLLAAYRQALSAWSLSGPTLFAPIIRMATQQARATVGHRPPKYTVLLILTDGAIMDMQDTVNAVIEASTLPLSILIVGIGRDNFGDMHRLDGDKERLASGNRTAVRDIVQFVEFEKFAGDGVRLAQELLAELPGQLLEYMRNNNVQCPPPLAAQPTMMHGAPAPPHGSAPPPPPGPAAPYPPPGAAPPPGAPYPPPGAGAYSQPGAPPPGAYPQPGAPYPQPSAGGYTQPGAPPPPGAYPQPGAAAPYPPPSDGYPQPSAPPPPPGAYPQPGAPPPPPGGYPAPGGGYPQPGAAYPQPGSPQPQGAPPAGYPSLAAPVAFNAAPPA